uniref:Short-chain dehydrogenase TIC 32, chloroplastic-like n=1 Tax=Ananas comosus var. bracteatus TaxID=296719 RepID=A0A6V7NJU3_ANACO|nr:unnamed protein product [Ananas comosus var. bracteatus]
MGVRNASAGACVKEVIIKEIPNAKVDVMVLDLSSMSSIRNFAENFNSQNLPLNILINNAGIAFAPFTLSEDDIELHFATNHLGHFLLTHLLLEGMKTTAQETNIEGRIIIVSSDSYKLTYHEGIRFDRINDELGKTLFLKISYFSFSLYFCFLANILHAHELSKQLKHEDVKITVNALHPGGIVTNILRYQGFLDGMTFLYLILFHLFSHILYNVTSRMKFEQEKHFLADFEIPF